MPLHSTYLTYEKNFCYETENYEITITQCSREATGKISIPSKIDHTYVENIGEEAFKDCVGITEIELPESLRVISRGAFSGCDGLKSVALPKYVWEVGDCAFSNCSGLKLLIYTPRDFRSPSRNRFIGDPFKGCKRLSIMVCLPMKDDTVVITHVSPNGESHVVIPREIYSKPVTEIEKEAFAEKKLITQISFPSTLIELPLDVFEDWPQLISISVDPNNPKYTDLDGVLFNGDRTKLIRCPEGRQGYYHIPESVREIGPNAFLGCGKLTGVAIPNSLIEIGQAAFNCCTCLVEIVIPDSVTTLGDYAFAGCHCLVRVNIPELVTQIAYCTFDACTSLFSISVDKNNSAFCDVDGVLFNKDRTAILWYPKGRGGRYTIPLSVTELSDNVLFKCFEGVDISVSEDHSNYTSFDGVMFNKELSCLVFYPRGKIGDYAIPESVTEIERGAFCGCKGITGVKIPDSVTIIGERAFCDCAGLDEVELPNSVTEIGSYAFLRCNGLVKISIPDSVTSMGYCVFDDCLNLKSIAVKNLSSRFNVVRFSGRGSLFKELWEAAGITIIEILDSEGVISGNQSSANSEAAISTESEIDSEQEDRNRVRRLIRNKIFCEICEDAPIITIKQWSRRGKFNSHLEDDGVYVDAINPNEVFVTDISIDKELARSGGRISSAAASIVLRIIGMQSKAG